MRNDICIDRCWKILVLPIFSTGRPTYYCVRYGIFFTKPENSLKVEMEELLSTLSVSSTKVLFDVKYSNILLFYSTLIRRSIEFNYAHYSSNANTVIIFSFL